MNSAHFSLTTLVFHKRILPEEGFVVGYAAIINGLDLKMPMPFPIAIVCKRNKKYQNSEWKVFPKKYLPEDNSDLKEIEALYNHLVFALKYEGVNLLLFSLLAKHYSVIQLTGLVNFQPTGQYSRRIWFLIEWITGTILEEKGDLSKKGYVPLLNDKLQFAIDGTKSARHLVINNLPGTRMFCPLINRTPKLEKYTTDNISRTETKYLKNIHKDLLLRASAFLLLKDSRASFNIEGENPKSKRAVRWGQAIGQAGTKELTIEELQRLQQVVIENPRFMEMGFRRKGGFVGEHDRLTGEPLPEHISAKWQDVESLIEGMLQTGDLLLKSKMDAVLSAAIIAFGFVFIHPFEDGNGRIHRYLIHHILAGKKFSQQGIIFPISYSMLNHIAGYKEVLASHSQPLLDFIEWKETKDHNVEVLNDTIDYYRFFDATKQAEFLYDCVNDTVQNIIPDEISYLIRFDEFKKYIEDDFEMPDKVIAVLIRFLEQNNGKLSKRAKENEFAALSDSEVLTIEEQYRKIFLL